MVVSKIPGVINIKYEDFLKNGKFKLDDLDISLPPIIKKHNDLISEYEMSIYNSDILSEEKLQEFNMNFTEIKPEYVMTFHHCYDGIRFISKFFEPKDDSKEENDRYHNFINEFEKEMFESITQVIPKNIFEELNYKPLSLQQIMSK